MQEPRQAPLPQRIGAGLRRAGQSRWKKAVGDEQRNASKEEDVDVSGEGDAGGNADRPDEGEDQTEGQQHGSSSMSAVRLRVGEEFCTTSSGC